MNVIFHPQDSPRTANGPKDFAQPYRVVCLSVCLTRFFGSNGLLLHRFLTNKQRGRKKETSAASPPLGGGYSADGSALEGAEEMRRAYVWRLPGRAKESGSHMLLFTATPSSDSCSRSFVCPSVRLSVCVSSDKNNEEEEVRALCFIAKKPGEFWWKGG
jgi:hypothetical protein